MSNQEPRKPRPYDPGDPERKAEAVALFLAYLRAAAELAQGGHLGSAFTLATAAALIVEPWAEKPETAPGFWSTMSGKVIAEARYAIPDKFCTYEACDQDPAPGSIFCPDHKAETDAINRETVERLREVCEVRRAGKCKPVDAEPPSVPLGEAPQPRGSDTPTIDLEPVNVRPAPCLDPDKMNGAGDGFGGEDGFSSPAVEPWHPMKRVSFPVAPDLVPSAAVGPSAPILGWSRESFDNSDNLKTTLAPGATERWFLDFTKERPALVFLAALVARRGGELRVYANHYEKAGATPGDGLDEVRSRLLVAIVTAHYGGDVVFNPAEVSAVAGVKEVAYYTTAEGDYILSLPRPKGSPAPNPAL